MAYYQKRDVSAEIHSTYQESYSHFFERFFHGRRLSPGRLLDVGCGPGLFLSLARQKGWEVQGVDPSRTSVEMARSVYGLPIQEGRIEEISFPDESFDMVTFWNVLDALSDPKGVLRKTYRFLKKGGILFARVINVRFHLGLYRLWESMAPKKGNRPPPVIFHVHNFSESTLRQMLKQSGFEKIKVRNSLPTPGDPYGDSLRFSKKGVQLQKIVVHGVSEALFYGTLGQFCFGSSLFAEARRGANIFDEKVWEVV